MSAPPAAPSADAHRPMPWPAPRVVGRRQRADRRRASPPTRRATPAANALANTGTRRRLDRRRGQHARPRPWCRCRPSPISARAPRRCRSTTRGTFAADARSPSTCPRTSRSATAIAAIDQHDERASACRPPSTAASPGTAKAFQQSCQRAMPLILAALARGLYRARHALRELHPSDHDPLDAALGRRRRGARAAGLRQRSSPSSR